MTGPRGSAASLLKNASSQIGGRLFLSLGRLGATLLIVHLLGTDRFGEYALVLNFVVLFEWLSDFGQTDIAVRDICQAPGRRAETLSALVWLKAGQGLLLFALLPLLLATLGYPAPIVWAGLAGGASLPCYAAVQVFRTQFKADMVMERDVVAELGSVAAMLPLTWWACHAGAGLAGLVGCYSLARLAFLGLAWCFAGARPETWRLGGGREALALLRQAAPLGFAGLLVALYDSMATVMLSKLAEMHDVAAYAAATRFVYPVIIVVQSLGSAFYPPLSAQWRVSMARFTALQQGALDMSILVGGGLFCGIYGGASFLMGLLGPAIAEAAPVLRLMAAVVLARAITTAMSPLIVVAGRQTMALWLTSASVLLQFAVLLLLVPRFGVMGAVSGYLALELLLGIVPVSMLGQHVTGISLSWAVPVRLVLCAVFAVSLATLLPTSGGVMGGILSGLFYLGLALGSGTISIQQGRALLAEIASSRRATRLPDAAA